MASTTSSNFVESPFTATDPDLFALVQSLPSNDPDQYLKQLSPDGMPSKTQLQAENDRLKAELVAMRSQRQIEQHAYGAFVRSSENLNAQLPPQAKSPAMRLALQNLVEASREYRNVANGLNQSFDNVHDLISTSSHEPTSFDHSTSSSTHQPNPRHKVQQTALAIKSALAELHIPCPRDLVSVDAALADLNNNVMSFADFMVNYLNGRYKHLTSGMRSQVDTVIGGLFSDPGDARQVLDQIMKVVKEGIKYTESEVQAIGADVVHPLGVLLWTLVRVLEEEEEES